MASVLKFFPNTSEPFGPLLNIMSRFEIALSKPFLVDRSIHYSLSMLAYAPDLKITRKRLQDTLKDIVVIDKKEKISTHEHIFSVGNFPWSKDVKILLKSPIPPEEGESWLNHAKQQCHKRLKPVTATGLILMISKRKYEYKGQGAYSAIWRNVTIKETLESEIIYEEFPFQGKGPIIAFDPNRR
ncbi:predicted protein [Sclerotinia sclerotiorum 1980 UF-70]|uniref:Uncharacterized protein n=1 Tax=Sclerotinia sclerotiorum (strain ATCC 18683 / 1980 / Ss-1) TaxID=665079 RepID=A7F3F8_SCLS1|nr:predicted protein [Sclerotinia sclerotiorum 1980 UF-70]EDN97279.1 predicted protein [Sclerotinia sclerotiorum 1980 UF-70]